MLSSTNKYFAILLGVILYSAKALAGGDVFTNAMTTCNTYLQEASNGIQEYSKVSREFTGKKIDQDSGLGQALRIANEKKEKAESGLASAKELAEKIQKGKEDAEKIASEAQAKYEALNQTALQTKAMTEEALAEGERINDSYRTIKFETEDQPEENIKETKDNNEESNSENSNSEDEYTESENSENEEVVIEEKDFSKPIKSVAKPKFNQADAIRSAENLAQTISVDMTTNVAPITMPTIQPTTISVTDIMSEASDSTTPQATSNIENAVSQYSITEQLQQISNKPSSSFQKIIEQAKPVLVERNNGKSSTEKLLRDKFDVDKSTYNQGGDK